MVAMDADGYVHGYGVAFLQQMLSEQAEDLTNLTDDVLRQRASDHVNNFQAGIFGKPTESFILGLLRYAQVVQRYLKRSID